MQKNKMQAANLTQLVEHIHQGTARQYLGQLGNTTIRDQELAGIARLAAHFPPELSAFQQVYVGYDVPQISKEFDLLIFDMSHRILNIELKSDVTYAVEKVRKQLVNNHYYLSQASDHVALFTYNSDLDRIYHLTEQGTLATINLQDAPDWRESIFYQTVSQFKSVSLSDVDTILQPQAYVVSPFSQLNVFLKGDYLLLQPQQQLKNQMLAMHEKGVYAVKMATGVGKTLMIYDLVKTLQVHHDVLLIHIGALNAAQTTLRRQYGWQILPERQFLKKIKGQRMRHYDIVIVDDAQRLAIRHVNAIKRYFEGRATQVFLIGDPNQQNKVTTSKHNYFATITRAFGSQHLMKLSK